MSVSSWAGSSARTCARHVSGGVQGSLARPGDRSYDLGGAGDRAVHRDVPPGNAGKADAYVHGFRAAMLPHWGEHAHVKYADPTVHDYRAAYFGATAHRLAQVRETYDPDAFFTQPQAI